MLTLKMEEGALSLPARVMRSLEAPQSLQKQELALSCISMTTESVRQTNLQASWTWS